MTEYHINDDWILTRVMGQSSSFNQWINELLTAAEKSLELENPEAAEKLKKKKDLLELKGLDEKLQKVDRILSTEKLYNVEFLGDFISTAVYTIAEKSVKKSLGKLSDFNLDFVTGKRKNLASVLYDVTKERGIDSEGILYLIQSLPDLESFLYSTSVKKYYRDHTEHQLRVAVLGDFLLEQNVEQGVLLGIVAEILGVEKPLLKEKLWWVTGLVHDIGYPLSKMTAAVNWSLLNQILKCYPTLDLEVVPMEVALSQTPSQKEYITLLEEGLSPEARALLRAGAGLDGGVPVPQVQAFPGSKGVRPEFTFTSSVALDHGVLGALTLLRSLGTPEDIRAHRDEYEGYILAAKAIALHNFKDKLKDFVFDDNPLAFLLVLVDEMQEWGRPIPLQIRDSYFTTELKKVALLDEIIVAIDAFEWKMQFRNTQAKRLIDFDFGRLCSGKQKAFIRLDRGSQFQETRLLLEDYEGGGDKAESGGLSGALSSRLRGIAQEKEKAAIPGGPKGVEKMKKGQETLVGAFQIRI